jgi:lysophospholipase L1-like esterase
MWGAGASLEADRLLVQIHRQLGAAPGLHDLWLVNASRSASNSGKLLKRYRSHLLLFQPDLVVVDLSNNDTNAESFRKNLTSLTEINRVRGIATLLVKEPNSTEWRLVLGARHKVMAEVAEQAGIPVVDMHGYLESSQVVDSGVLYHDRVHLTSYGQARAGEFLAQAISRHFGSLLTAR